MKVDEDEGDVVATLGEMVAIVILVAAAICVTCHVDEERDRPQQGVGGASLP